MTTTTFYPEMNQTANVNAQIIIERLYKMSKVTCLNGIELKENRSVTFQYKNAKGNVYYVTDAAVKKLSNNYTVAFSNLLD